MSIEKENLPQKDLSLNEDLKFDKIPKPQFITFINSVTNRLKNINDKKKVESLKEGGPWTASYKLETADINGLFRINKNFISFMNSIGKGEKITVSDNGDVFSIDLLSDTQLKGIFLLEKFSMDSENIYNKDGNSFIKFNDLYIDKKKAYAVDVYDYNRLYFVNLDDKIYVFENAVIAGKSKFRQLVPNEFEKDDKGYLTIRFLDGDEKLIENVVEDNDVVEVSEKEEDKNIEKPDLELPEILKTSLEAQLTITEKPTLEDVQNIVQKSTGSTFAIAGGKLLPLGDMIIDEEGFILDFDGNAYVNFGGNLFFDINKNIGVDVYYYDPVKGGLEKYKEINDIAIFEKQEDVKTQIVALQELTNFNVNDIVADDSKPTLYNEIGGRSVSCFDVYKNNETDVKGINYHVVYNTDNQVDLKISSKKINLVVEGKKIKLIGTGKQDHYLIGDKTYNITTVSSDGKKEVVFVDEPKGSGIVAKDKESLLNTKLDSKIFYINPYQVGAIPKVDETFLTSLKEKYNCDLYTIKINSGKILEIQKIQKLTGLQVFQVGEEYFVGLTDSKTYLESVQKKISTISELPSKL